MPCAFWHNARSPDTSLHVSMRCIYVAAAVGMAASSAHADAGMRGYLVAYKARWCRGGNVQKIGGPLFKLSTGIWVLKSEPGGLCAAPALRREADAHTSGSCRRRLMAMLLVN
jgi:hypothetical protein